MDFIGRPAASMHWIAAASLILGACATVAPVEYPQDHPARKNVSEAAAQRVTLEVANNAAGLGLPPSRLGFRWS